MRMRSHAPRRTAPTLALAGVLFAAAAGSTGCTLDQKRGALLGAAVGTGVGLIIATEARHARDTRYARGDRYDARRADRHRYDDAPTRRRGKRRDRTCD